MRQKSGPEKQPAEDAIRDIRRATRRHFSAEEKIRVVAGRLWRPVRLSFWRDRKGGARLASGRERGARGARALGTVKRCLRSMSTRLPRAQERAFAERRERRGLAGAPSTGLG